MIKKTIQSFAFFAFIQVFIFSCCNRDFDVYYDSIIFLANDTLDADATSVSSDNLVLNFEPMYDYIMASNFRELEKFSNSAYATSCDDNYTYKETVSNILITANVDMLGISAGTALNDKLLYVNPETQERESFDMIYNVLNRQNGYARYGQLEFVFNEDLESNTMVIFTLELNIEENDRTLTGTTEEITIE